MMWTEKIQVEKVAVAKQAVLAEKSNVSMNYLH